MTKNTRSPPEVRQRAVRMVLENQNEYDSQWAALSSIVKWFTEFGHLNRGDMLTSEQHRCTNEERKF